ncbi:glycosyltransferase family 39 protein [Candidatus Daviesbacteria bacterium]|nr:glycosyltransferase family 39 protein [Candidatus Daviesbacteria bacterium]
MLKTGVILITFIIAGWFLLTFKLTDVPPGINGDEAAIGLNAIYVAKDGYDLKGNFLPIFTSLPDSSDWKQPITFYSEVLAFKFFGPSYFTLRAVSVFYVLLSAVLIFSLIKMLLGRFLASLGVLLFLTTPIMVIQSHLAMENIAPIPFVILWLIGILKYSQQGKERYLVLMGLSLIAAFYSYLGMRLMVPILFLLSAALILYANRQKKLKVLLRQEIIFAVLFIPFAISLLFFKNQYPGSLWGLYRPYIVDSYQTFFLPYFSNFDPSFLYIFGDTTPYHSTGKYGMFLIATLPLFILGIIKIVKLNQLIPNFIILSFFLPPILFGFGSTIHRASRLLGLVPVYVIICCYGLIFLLEYKRIFKVPILFVGVLLIFLNFSDFIKDYWFEYPKRVQSEFARPYHLGFEKLYEESKKHNLIPLVQNDLHMQNSTAFSFFELTFFPQPVKKWSNLEKIPPRSAILIGSGSDFRIMINKNDR